MTSIQKLGHAVTRSARSSFVAIRATKISTSTPCRVMEINAPFHWTFSDPLLRHAGPSRRSMVTITKTKVSELPQTPENEDESTPRKAFDANDYKVLSEELIITSSCLSRVDKLIKMRKDKEGEEQNPFLRVFVDAGGCSGFQYHFELDEEFDPDEDIVLVSSSSDEVPRIVIDDASLGFLRGSKLDYVQEMIKSSFVVTDNPQSESACGCGSSFAVKNFSANPALD